MRDPRTPKMAWLGGLFGGPKSRPAPAKERSPHLECLEDRLVLATLTWQGVAGNNWNNAANWVENDVPQDGDTLIFDSTIPPTTFQSINDIANLELVSIQIINNGSSSWGISGLGITLQTSIEHTGTGTVTDTLSFASITLAGAVDIINDASSILTITSPTDTAGHVLTVSGTGNTSLTGAVSGTGGITKQGSGNLNLSGNSTYSGNTVLDEGTIATQGAGIGDNSAVSVASGATLVLNGNETIGSLAGVAGSLVDLNSFTLLTGGNNTSTIFAGVLSDSGGLTKLGAGTMTLSGNNTYTGTTTVSVGILELQGGSAIENSSAVTIASGATLSLLADEEIGSLAGATGSTVQLGANKLTFGGNNTSTSFTGEITGTGSIEKRGTGTFSFGGAQTYTGGTTVQNGVINGSTNSLRGTIVNNASILFNQTSAGTYSGSMSGTGTVTKQGLGAVTFSGTNTYTGTTTVSVGTLILTGGSALSDTNAVTVAAGATLQVNTNETIGSLAGVAGSFVNLNGGTLTTGGVDSNTTFAGDISGSGGLVKQGLGQFDLTGTNSYTGGTTVSAGTLRGSSASLQGDILNDARLIFRQLDPAGGIYAGAISGSGTLEKEGANALVMTGNNTYTGLTTITLGALIIDGQLTSNVAVNGGSLSGKGTILGAVNVNNNTTLAPGSPGTAAGILTTGNVTLVPNANFAINVGGINVGTGYDRLQVNGTVVLGNATLGITGAAGFIAPIGMEFQIVTNDGNDAIVGTFAGLAEGSAITVGSNRYVITYQGGDGNDVVLTAVANAPAPKFSNGVLFIEGSDGPDSIILTQTIYQGFNVLSVQVNGTTYGTFNGVTQIIIQAKGGDDRIAYTNEIRIPTIIDGGAGYDTLDFTAIKSPITAYIGPGVRIPGSAALFESIENIVTGSGDDTFVIGTEPGQEGKLSGGGGTNTLDLSRSPKPVNVNLETGKVDYKMSVEQIQRVFIPLFQPNTVNPTSASYSPSTQKNFQLSSLATVESDLEKSFGELSGSSHDPRRTSSSAEKIKLQELLRVTGEEMDATSAENALLNVNIANNDSDQVDAVFADETSFV